MPGPDIEVMFRTLGRLILPVAVTVALAGPAGAASSTPTGTIALGQTAQAPRYGGSVSFVTTVQGRPAAKSSLYVTVVCSQGSTLVYQWSAAPSFTFPLVDQAGQGLEWPGGAASCSATLVYKVPQGRGYSITWLDQVAFGVSG